MRKNVLLILLFFGAFTASSFAQCTPDTTMSGLTKPNEAQGLDSAYATFLYETTVHIHVPEDTIIPGVPVPIPIDSARLVSVLGMPQSLNYYPNKASKTWAGGEYGCFLISGTPLNNEVGLYSISMTIMVYSGVDSVSQDLTFAFTVADSSLYNSIHNNNKLELSELYPNPASDKINIKYYSKDNSITSFILFNTLGQAVIQEDFNSKSGNNSFEINVSNLSKGVYFYKLSENSDSKSGKIIIR